MPEQWRNGRRVRERIVITGQLVLMTPAHFGNGDKGGLSDIPLLRDARDPSRPLLTGTSIAGALRAHLLQHERGYGAAGSTQGTHAAEQLFGHIVQERTDDPAVQVQPASVESWIMIDDSVGTPPSSGPPVELRDGVAIDPKTRAAEINEETRKGKKFDIELLASGTTFPLTIELWVPDGEDAQAARIKQGLGTALHGLASGAIRLGARKQRGLGRCQVESWHVRAYDMSNLANVMAWLDSAEPSREPDESDIIEQLGVEHEPHAGEALRIRAAFDIEGSVLIRANAGGPDDIDAIHLRSVRNGVYVPVLSGTSLAGSIRARALRIATTLFGEARATEVIDGMFGARIELVRARPSEDETAPTPTGSRVIVDEATLQNAVDDRIQSRVKIDRFTGGAYPGALFSQMPVQSRPQNPMTVTICLELRRSPLRPEQFDLEAGLLLQVLKDLWTGDLPIGGEQSVGRGRLRGREATIETRDDQWVLRDDGSGSLVWSGRSTPESLEERFGAPLRSDS